LERKSHRQHNCPAPDCDSFSLRTAILLYTRRFVKYLHFRAICVFWSGWLVLPQRFVLPRDDDYYYPTPSKEFNDITLIGRSVIVRVTAVHLYSENLQTFLSCDSYNDSDRNCYRSLSRPSKEPTKPPQAKHDYSASTVTLSDAGASYTTG